MTIAIAFAFAPLPKVAFLSLFIQPFTEGVLYSPSVNGFIQSNHDFLFFFFKCMYLFIYCIFQSRKKKGYILCLFLNEAKDDTAMGCNAAFLPVFFSLYFNSRANGL